VLFTELVASQKTGRMEQDSLLNNVLLFLGVRAVLGSSHATGMTALSTMAFTIFFLVIVLSFISLVASVVAQRVVEAQEQRWPVQMRVLRDELVELVRSEKAEADDELMEAKRGVLRCASPVTLQLEAGVFAEEELAGLEVSRPTLLASRHSCSLRDTAVKGNCAPKALDLGFEEEEVTQGGRNLCSDKVADVMAPDKLERPVQQEAVDLQTLAPVLLGLQAELNALRADVLLACQVPPSLWSHLSAKKTPRQALVPEYVTTGMSGGLPVEVGKSKGAPPTRGPPAPWDFIPGSGTSTPHSARGRRGPATACSSRSDLASSSGSSSMMGAEAHGPGSPATQTSREVLGPIQEQLPPQAIAQLCRQGVLHRV